MLQSNKNLLGNWTKDFDELMDRFRRIILEVYPLVHRSLLSKQAHIHKDMDSSETEGR